MKNGKRFLERMNEIDDELLLRSEGASASNKNNGVYKKLILIVAAAFLLCAMVLTAAGLFIRKPWNDADDGEGDILTVPISDVYWVDTRERNGKHARTEQHAYVWPWNCRDVYNQYTSVTVGKNEYVSRVSYYGGEVLANQIAKKVCDAEAVGYDEYSSLNNKEDYYLSIKCEVFEIKGVDSNRIVAVKYDGYDGYYAFLSEDREQLNTFGELVSALDLTQKIKLNSVYYDEENDGNDTDEHYALSDENSDALWNILKECFDAPSVDSSLYDRSKRKLSFAIDSDTLGVNNLSFSFNSEGYLWTNIEDYAYVYYLGEDAVNEIFDFAVKNKLMIYLPEEQYLVGIVTEIGEDYIKVDDSVLMKNPDEGIEFTVSANHMNIRRYIVSGYLTVGSTVRIKHGYILKEYHTQIDNAVNLEECIITPDGDALVYH